MSSAEANPQLRVMSVDTSMRIRTEFSFVAITPAPAFLFMC